MLGVFHPALASEKLKPRSSSQLAVWPAMWRACHPGTWPQYSLLTFTQGHTVHGWRAHRRDEPSARIPSTELVLESVRILLLDLRLHDVTLLAGGASSVPYLEARSLSLQNDTLNSSETISS